jgi:hypothetical protein
VDFRSVGIEYHVAGDAWWLNGHPVPGPKAQGTSPLMAAL